jgi:hypothetical protein
MNLVQLQDDLRMLPLPALQSKAQGQDPNTPPWLAAAVLNERMTAQQKAGMAQGAAQGPQPSVVEKLQSGLMSLEAQKMQQGQQQMMQQAAQTPQAVPEQAPQPEMQPEPEMMMARGGIARLPANPQMFNYRQGGVIGFADGGETGANLDAVKERAEQAIAKLRSYGLNQQKQNPQGYQQAQKEAAEAQQAVKDAMTTYQAELQQSGMNKPYFGSPKPTTAPLQGRKPMPESQGIGSIFVPGSQSGLRPEIEQNQPAPAKLRPAAPSAPKPEVGIATLPAAQKIDPIATTQGIQAAFQAKDAPPTIEQILANKERFRVASGAKRAGEAESEQLDEYKAETERLRKERDRADALYTLAARGGLSEIAERGAKLMHVNNLADTIRNDETSKMRAAIQKMKQAEAEGNYKEYAEGEKEYRQAERARANAAVTAATQISNTAMQVAEQARGHDMQARSADLDRQSRERIQSMSNRGSGIDEKVIDDLIKNSGLSYADAYARMKQMSSGYKGEMTLEQAAKRVDELLQSADGRRYVREVQAKAKEAGQPVPDFMSIRQTLLDREMGGSARPRQGAQTPSAGSSGTWGKMSVN